jgi:hypothetical protein
MRLLWSWHIPRSQLTNGLMIGALVGSEASASNLSLEQEECKITKKNFIEPLEIGTRKK